jgi:hypothetical protein
LKSLLNKKQADSGHFAAAATKAIKNTFQSKDPYVSAIGQVHPSHKKWYKLTLDIEFEALQTPTTLTTGIFPSCPTLLASLVRGEECKDNFSVDSPLEDVASKEWEERPWGGNCMVCIRAGNVDLLRKVVAKASLTAAQNGHRCLILIEWGPQEIENKSVKEVPEIYIQNANHTLLVEYPAGTLLWAGPNGHPGPFHLDR